MHTESHYYDTQDHNRCVIWALPSKPSSLPTCSLCGKDKLCDFHSHNRIAATYIWSKSSIGGTLQKFHRWNFHSLEHLFPGTFALMNQSSVELSVPNMSYRNLRSRLYFDITVCLFTGSNQHKHWCIGQHLC